MIGILLSAVLVVQVQSFSVESTKSTTTPVQTSLTSTTAEATLPSKLAIIGVQNPLVGA